MSVTQGTVQFTNVNSGTQPAISLGKQAEQLESQLQPRMYTQCYNSVLYSWGKTETALSANSITLNATTTPVIGVWNPSSSTVNLVILQACLQTTLQAASSTRQGAFVWATSTGNGVISTGNSPFNRKTLANTGSQAKGFDLATALTGITNNLVIQEAADLTGGVAITTASVPATAAVSNQVSVQNFDGSLIVPPGGVLALLNTNSTTNISVASRILWAEVAL